MNSPEIATSAEPVISVIIPTYNSEGIISRCLDALNHQTLPRDDFEIIVIDDGSRDHTLKIVSCYPAIQIVQQAHAGPAVARNFGANLARGELLVFTDSDCAPAPDWLEKLTQPFQDKNVMGVKGVYRTEQKNLVSRFVQLEYETKYDRMAKALVIDFIDTYSASYRKNVFLSNGGFDRSFPVPSVEDQEFSFRLARKGYPLVLAGSAAVYHIHDETITDYFRRKYGIGYWKAVMLKWLPEKLFSDSHTLPSQRLQILLLAVIGLQIVLAFLGWNDYLLIILSLLIFYGSDQAFIRKILKKDIGVIWIAPILLLARALSLGIGLGLGFLFPPAATNGAKPGLSIGDRIIKRSVDIFVSFIGLILSLPILIISSIAIKLDSKGPFLYVQVRAGKNGKQFRMFKLRTMIEDADKKLDEVMGLNPLTGLVYKIPNDPRVTKVGRCLRRWSIDELPQLWNVFTGSMSLVGPRPEELWIVDQYTDQQRERLAIKPGLTGPMQIGGRRGQDIDASLDQELSYIKSYSLCKDLSILLSSVPGIISGKRAY